MTTSTATTTGDSTPPYMYSSVSSLSSNQQPSVTRVYKQAAQLFLTRRVKESLDVLEPLINKSAPPGDTTRSNGGIDEVPNISTASRGARVKIWSLYISILNILVDMGPEEGKRLFGLARWKKLVAKAREGHVWEEVVREGYDGMEGNVDADVVANLATLLLAHAPSQKKTQQRLETYLSASNPPPVDAPKDLNSRLRVLEIYSLHVLPRNEEWEYAREFISLSQEMDEERKEAFLQALALLQEEPKHAIEREREIQRQRDEKLAEVKRIDEDRMVEERRTREEQQLKRHPEAVMTKDPGKGAENKQPESSQKSITSSKATESSKQAKTPPGGKTAVPQPPRSSIPAKKPFTPPPSLYQRASLTLQALQRNLVGMSKGLSKQPMALLRMVLFLAALIIALARRDVRDRLRKIRDSAWDNVRRTVGMGVKVSYI